MLPRARELARARPWVLAVLVVLTVAGGALRFVEAANPTVRQSADEGAYARLAREVADTRRYQYQDARQGTDPLHWAPGAVFVFAAAHELVPADRAGVRYDVPAAYPVQAAAGTLTIPLTFALAALLAGPVAGLLAAGLWAFYPPAIRVSAELLTEPLGTLALVAALLAVALALRRGRPLPLLGAGAALGLAVLVRGDLVFLPFGLAVLVGLVLWRGDRLRTGVAGGAALAVGAVLCIAPWSLYASLETGRLVPVTTGGSSNLFVGTYLPGEGTMLGLKRDMEDELKTRYPRLRGVPPTRLPQSLTIALIAERNPGESKEAALRGEAKRNLRVYGLGDPLAFAAMMGEKTWSMWETTSRGAGRGRVPGEATVHLLLVLLAAAALVAGLIRTRSPALLVLAAALLYVSAINAVFVPEPRHNLPFMPVLFAAGAAGAILLLRDMRSATPIAQAGSAGGRPSDGAPPPHPPDPAPARPDDGAAAVERPGPDRVAGT